MYEVGGVHHHVVVHSVGEILRQAVQLLDGAVGHLQRVGARQLRYAHQGRLLTVYLDDSGIGATAQFHAGYVLKPEQAAVG